MIEKFGSFIPISENLKYHLDNKIPIVDNIFRPYSKSYFSIIEEARVLYEKGILSLDKNDLCLFESTDIGRFSTLDGDLVPLDLPIEEVVEINEAKYKGKEVILNSPSRSPGPKKYKVYVKDPKSGKIKIVNFGDVKGGLKAKVSDPKARKSFSARHNCKDKKDKTKAGYWSCRLNRYGNLFGGKTYPGYW